MSISKVQQIIDSTLRYKKDYPIEKVNFVDITAFLATPDALKTICNEFSSMLSPTLPIIAPESRGFIFASGVSAINQNPVILARKKSKLPFDTINISINTEYSDDLLCVHKEDIEKFGEYTVMDDVLATGGTVLSIIKMLKSLDKKCKKVYFTLELTDLGGRELLEKEGVEVISLFKLSNDYIVKKLED